MLHSSAGTYVRVSLMMSNLEISLVLFHKLLIHQQAENQPKKKEREVREK